jgi:hypothetical protein
MPSVTMGPKGVGGYDGAVIESRAGDRAYGLEVNLHLPIGLHESPRRSSKEAMMHAHGCSPWGSLRNRPAMKATPRTLEVDVIQGKHALPNARGSRWVGSFRDPACKSRIHL